MKSRGFKDDTNITNTSDHISLHHKDAGVMSPPESSQNSSDDDMNIRRGRGRELANLAELQAAIRIIEQRRVSSPDRIGEESRKARISLGLPGSRFDLPQKASDLKLEASSPPPLSAGARKISHSRSSTTTSALLDFPRNKLDSPSRSYSESDFDEMDEEEVRMKPPMVRKKSGELVRPALRPSSAKGRPASMPGTPTYSKAVHFDTSLEHVRHFLQVDKPIAVSAGSSPVESIYEDEAEFPFGNHGVLPKSLPFEWEISLTNFPNEKLERRALPVRVERVYLSSDNKNLMGAVAANNIAFHKLVVVRFTLDYWKTTSEVVADFNNDIRHKQINDGYDRFIFSIKLADQANLENKTMFFCVRYNVNGQEFWDNNNSFNYQVDFSKKPKPQKGKNGMQGNAAKPIPRNNMSPAFSPRPRSLPILSNDFDAKFSPYDFSSYPQPAARIIGDSPIRFRNSKPTNDVVPDAPGRLTSAVGQAFGNRYDFGASLSAAIQASNSSTSDRGGFLRRDEANSVPSAQFTPAHESSVTSLQPSNTTQPGTREQKPKVEKGANVRGRTKADPTASPNPVALAAEKPPLQSSSYNELIDKYCFVRSKVGREGAGNVC